MIVLGNAVDLSSSAKGEGTFRSTTPSFGPVDEDDDDGFRRRRRLATSASSSSSSGLASISCLPIRSRLGNGVSFLRSPRFPSKLPPIMLANGGRLRRIRPVDDDDSPAELPCRRMDGGVSIGGFSIRIEAEVAKESGSDPGRAAFSSIDDDNRRLEPRVAMERRSSSSESTRVSSLWSSRCSALWTPSRNKEFCLSACFNFAPATANCTPDGLLRLKVIG